MITVVMPIRNGSNYLEDALQSVLQQEHPVEEILIVNDGSTDETPTLLERLEREIPQVHILKGPERGPGPARNVGIQAARGNIIAFIDADDLWPADKLELQIGRLNAEPAVDVVSGYVSYFDTQASDKLAPAENSRVENNLVPVFGAFVFRKNVFDRIGLIDESQRFGEDVDFNFRLRESNIPLATLSVPTLYYRQHMESMTSVESAAEKRDFLNAIRKSLGRRRAKGKTVENLEPLESYIEAAEPQV